MARTTAGEMVSMKVALMAVLSAAEKAARWASWMVAALAAQTVFQLAVSSA